MLKQSARIPCHFTAAETSRLVLMGEPHFRRRMVVVWIAGSSTSIVRGLQLLYFGKSRPTLHSS